MNQIERQWPLPRDRQRARHQTTGGLVILWLHDDTILHATVLADAGRLYHLIVEKLPYPDDWDWTAWQHGYSQGKVKSGTAKSAHLAMDAAETIIRDWESQLSVAEAGNRWPSLTARPHA
jgi:hypothetical protein